VVVHRAGALIEEHAEGVRVTGTHPRTQTQLHTPYLSVRPKKFP
jgi:hypothetical protein